MITDETRQQLIATAKEAQRQAYMPYSHYAVGAALLTTSGRIISGCNVENASFGATICAERTAVVKAVSEGERVFVAVAVVTSNGMFPCGICRQVLNEFGPEMIVLTADENGTITNERPLSDLLPGSFGRNELDSGVKLEAHPGNEPA